MLLCCLFFYCILPYSEPFWTKNVPNEFGSVLDSGQFWAQFWVKFGLNSGWVQVEFGSSSVRVRVLHFLIKNDPIVWCTHLRKILHTWVKPTNLNFPQCCNFLDRSSRAKSSTTIYIMLFDVASLEIRTRARMTFPIANFFSNIGWYCKYVFGVGYMLNLASMICI